MAENLILYDGVCNLCNKAVQTVLKYDRKKRFQFASLQSHTGIKILGDYNLPLQKTDSFVLLTNGKIYERSTAALKVARHLKGLWPLLYVFIIVPPFIRDMVYNLIAKNRYSWFGKSDTCWLPNAEFKGRFID